MHATLSEKFPNVRLCALIVWIPILEKDSLEEALPSVGIMNDRRFRHYYDPNQIVGKTIANSVGWIEKVAWDIYLFYRPGTPWDKYSPKPSYWMHQLTDEWVKDDKYRTGDDLKNELVKSMESLLA